jgi:hypothetical protein
MQSVYPNSEEQNACREHYISPYESDSLLLFCNLVSRTPAPKKQYRGRKTKFDT